MNAIIENGKFIITQKMMADWIMGAISPRFDPGLLHGDVQDAILKIVTAPPDSGPTVADLESELASEREKVKRLMGVLDKIPKREGLLMFYAAECTAWVDELRRTLDETERRKP